MTDITRSIVRSVLDHLPYISGLRAELRTFGSYPAGHFHSVIPTTAEVSARLREHHAEHDDLAGIDLNMVRQRELLDTFRGLYPDVVRFPDERTEGHRYYFNQTVFCYADAVFLYSMLRHLKPRRIIEVGSGFSSAVMLDTVDWFFDHEPDITLIEPDPLRLKDVLRPEDFTRVTLIEDQVQRVPQMRFTSLKAGDLLFIDSSHVVKCGSDLQFLLFDVLPHLPVGVVVHFHDVFAGFEYPQQWLLKGRFWNEDYVLRAFLSFNNAWQIVLFGDYMVRAHKDWFAEHMPKCLKNSGASLYLKRIA